MKITNIKAHEILASGGNPTIETEVTLENGCKGRASVPYGASAGSHEATVLVDEDKSRWAGKGVLKVVENVETDIKDEIVGMDAEDQRSIDEKMIEMDGTENKAKLGGNAILSVSLATAKAVAETKNKQLFEYIIESYGTGEDLITLPQPMVVVIEGGKHADNTTDLQEYCLSSIKTDSVRENVRIIMESYHQLKKVLKKEGLSTNVGNEGAFAPNGIKSNEAPFVYMMKSIEAAGYKPGEDIGISIDAAASEFYENGKYNLSLEDKQLDSKQLIEYYQPWLEKYPINTLEDMLDEDDWKNWPAMTAMAKAKDVIHIADDLTVTNQERIQKAIDADAMTGVLIKLNQIGTLTETIDACMLCRDHDLMTVTSHRGGGETNDTSMVDVAVAVGSAYVKVGPTRGERVAKYNRLMEIERLVNNTN